MPVRLNRLAMALNSSWTVCPSHETFQPHLCTDGDYTKYEHYCEGHCCIGFLKHDLVKLLEDLLD